MITSKYAKRIYQFCSQWKDVGETKKYDLQDFKMMLGLLDDKGNEKMKQIKDFRESVLDVAVKQINEHTELHIDYTLEKKGKAFKSIIFTIKSQALAETIPFELVPGGGGPAGGTGTAPGGERRALAGAAEHRHAAAGGDHPDQRGARGGLQSVRARPENGQARQVAFPLGAPADHFGAGKGRSRPAVGRGRSKRGV